MCRMDDARCRIPTTGAHFRGESGGTGLSDVRCVPRDGLKTFPSSPVPRRRGCLFRGRLQSCTVAPTFMTSIEQPRPAVSTALQKAWWRSLFWVPTLYFAEGLPYNVINNTALRMYKSLGYEDQQITVSLGSIGIAWSLKPLWAAFLDMYKSKKFFVLATEALMGLVFAAVAMCLPLPGFFQISIALLWVAAFASSTQDICADGIYLTSLDEASQSRLAGVQGSFWVLGKVVAAGGLISVLDRVREAEGWPQQKLWVIVMLAAAGLMAALFVYHWFMLPKGSVSARPESASQVARDFVRTGVTFFHKRMFWGMLAFVFLYRLGEGLIMMEGQLFIQSSVEKGGLGMTAAQVSDIDAVWGTIASIVGGLLGGAFVSKMTLSRALGVLGLALNIPHITFVILSQMAAAKHGVAYETTVLLVSIEKFGYGFGFVGNMIYMMQQLAPGRSTMTHYAYATSLMNIMLVPTNMVSGPLANVLGFSNFFLVVMLASIPSAWAAFRAPFPIKESETLREGEEGKGQSLVTVDDPSRLTSQQIEVQGVAGRAALFAMLTVLAVLLLDANLLGWLQPSSDGGKPSMVLFVLLLANIGLKGFLGQRCWKASSRALELCAKYSDTTYRSNATGSRLVVGLCAAATVCVVAVGASSVF
jgi:MFS transporter, PAT family, beta-lactamase induction signal transducer AmpG